MSEAHPCCPTTVYGASKLAGELYALAFWRTHEMPVSVVRPFNTYGPREPYRGARAEVIPRFILRLLQEREPVIFGDGTQTRDFTFVDDTVDGIIRASTCDALVGEAVNVAYGQEVSIGNIAERLSALLGQAERTAAHADPRPGDVDRHFADITKARRLFDYDPKIDLDSGLERTVNWFRDNQILDRLGDEDTGSPNWES
jgi:UDP-glucose 4-epimerase